MSDAGQRVRAAEQRLFDRYGLSVDSRTVELADPALRVRVLEAGDPDGEPLVLVHGSGMLGSTWAPMLPGLLAWRLLAVDLPGFGLSDRYDYSVRSLRRHAVAQLESLLDALDLAQAPLVGTSLGAMWALSLALERPERVSSVVSIGVPAVALPGMHGDPGFTAMTLPVVGAVVSRLTPPTTGTARRAMLAAIGRPGVDRTPDEWFDVVRLGMRVPGHRVAMRSHLLLALRSGRPLPGNAFTDGELEGMQTPVLFVWGEDDAYGKPEIGRRAAGLMPRARLVIMPGGHAPFLDDPERCAALVAEFAGQSTKQR